MAPFTKPSNILCNIVIDLAKLRDRPGVIQADNARLQQRESPFDSAPDRQGFEELLVLQKPAIVEAG